MPQPAEKLARKEAQRRAGRALMETTSPMASATDELVCDFCSAPATPGSLTLFPCRDFQRRIVTRNGTTMMEVCSCHAAITIEPDEPVRVQRFVGGWMACPHCRTLIEANDSDELAEYAAAQGNLTPPPVAFFLAPADDPDDRGSTTPLDFLKSQQLGFWLHRIV